MLTTEKTSTASPPVRVAFIDHVARLSGAEINLVRLVEATDEIESTVILAEDGDLKGAMEDAGARVEILAMAERTRGLTRAQLAAASTRLRASGDVGRYAWRLRDRLRTLRPDVVHTNSLKAGVYGSLAARLAGVPCVWYLHDRLAPDYLPAPVVRPLRLMVNTVPDAVAVGSDATLSTLGRRHRPGLKIAKIPLPIPIPERPFELAPEVRNVGVVGRLTSWKGQHVFLDAFAQAFPGPPVRARLIGSAMFGEEDYERELRDQAQRLGIAARVDFAGFRPDVMAELEQLDILVHCSVLPDTLAASALEGMAAGLPVIAANSGGTATYIVDGQNGLLHEPGDVAGLAAALRRTASDAELRARIAAEGRRTAMKFGPDAVVGQFVDFYREVARRKERS